MNDPFFNINFAADRLFDQYQRHGNLIVAFDFDDTIFDWTDSGHTYNKVIDLLKECKELGFHLILFTCREGQILKEAVEFCNYLGIKPDSVNENTMRNSRKPLYNILLDDRAGLSAAYETLKEAISYIRLEMKK